jgi:hypothetical protein
LAENLHQPVFRLMDMPLNEYQGWIMFHAEKSRKAEAAKGNLLAADDDLAMVRAFGAQ